MIMGVMAFSHGEKPPEAIVQLADGPLCSGCRPRGRGMAPHELKEGFRKTYAQVKAAWSDALDKGIRKLPNGEMKKDERQI